MIHSKKLLDSQLDVRYKYEWIDATHDDDQDRDDDYHLQTSKLFRGYLLWNNLVFLDINSCHWGSLQYLSCPATQKENLQNQLKHLELRLCLAYFSVFEQSPVVRFLSHPMMLGYCTLSWALEGLILNMFNKSTPPLPPRPWHQIVQVLFWVIQAK